MDKKENAPGSGAIKRPAFAGSWYPSGARACENAIQTFLKGGRSDPCFSGKGLGGIVPHAGWAYSGRIACRVFDILARHHPGLDTIILFGAHMHSSSPGFTMDPGGVETPFGNLEVDTSFLKALVSRLSWAKDRIKRLSPKAFPDENTIELQFPFIRYFFPNSRIIVWGVPPTDLSVHIGQACAQTARDLGRSILVVGSTDMTHYGPNFAFEPAGKGKKALEWVVSENDAQAIRAMEKMDSQGILDQGLAHQNLCCPGAVAAAAAACKKMGAAKGICLDHATSFDIAPATSFVGYCGMIYV
ncbi:MAG: AmmeMemoRadiSam system protein B [Desulfobacter sp.]|nr:AmmeMemoRadiSam system protein B [Desulfobacter sp.]